MSLPPRLPFNSPVPPWGLRDCKLLGQGEGKITVLVEYWKTNESHLMLQVAVNLIHNEPWKAEGSLELFRWDDNGYDWMIFVSSDVLINWVKSKPDKSLINKICPSCVREIHLLCSLLWIPLAWVYDSLAPSPDAVVTIRRWLTAASSKLHVVTVLPGWFRSWDKCVFQTS